MVEWKSLHGITLYNRSARITESWNNRSWDSMIRYYIYSIILCNHNVNCFNMHHEIAWHGITFIILCNHNVICFNMHHEIAWHGITFILLYYVIITWSVLTCIIGPLLFLMYVNDMEMAVKCKLLLYADDSALLIPGKDLVELENVISEEFSTWKCY